MALKYIVDNEFEFDSVSEMEWIPLGGNKFHCLKDGKKVIAEVKSKSADGKSIEVRIEGHNFQVAIQEPLDQLIDEMGLGNIEAGKLSNVLAPMPGMVLELLVEPGQTVEPGTNLLILEAMKMENIIQADGVGVVAAVSVEKGAAVDKGQLLIEMT